MSLPPNTCHPRSPISIQPVDIVHDEQSCSSLAYIHTFSCARYVDLSPPTICRRKIQKSFSQQCQQPYGLECQIFIFLKAHYDLILKSLLQLVQYQTKIAGGRTIHTPFYRFSSAQRRAVRKFVHIKVFFFLRFVKIKIECNTGQDDFVEFC